MAKLLPLIRDKDVSSGEDRNGFLTVSLSSFETLFVLSVRKAASSVQSVDERTVIFETSAQ